MTCFSVKNQVLNQLLWIVTRLEYKPSKSLLCISAGSALLPTVELDGLAWESLGGYSATDGVAEAGHEGLTHSFDAASKRASHLGVSVGNS